MRYSHTSGATLFVRVPTAEFRHMGDRYSDLIHEAIENLGLEFNDVEFVTPKTLRQPPPTRHDVGLSAPPGATALRHRRPDSTSTAPLN